MHMLRTISLTQFLPFFFLFLFYPRFSLRICFNIFLSFGDLGRYAYNFNVFCDSHRIDFDFALWQTFFVCRSSIFILYSCYYCCSSPWALFHLITISLDKPIKWNGQTKTAATKKHSTKKYFYFHIWSYDWCP